MATKIKQGQSELTTELKQRGLGYAFKVNSDIFAKKFPNYTYFHFDLNSGCGYNEQADCIGSPLTFTKAMEDSGIRKYHASFCDIDEDAIYDLQRRVSDNNRCFVHHGNNRELVYTIPEIIKHYKEKPEYAIGSILCDPNGDDIPADELGWLNRNCPKLDVIVHWNATLNKRLRGGTTPDRRNIYELMDAIGKKHWLIREPSGMHQFSLLIGRNFKAGDYKAQGFHHLDGTKGQDIAKTCHLSAKQYMSESGQLGMSL